MEEWERGWLAAAIDGEGHIRCRPHYRWPTSRDIGVLVDNTDTEFASLALRLLGPAAYLKTLSSKSRLGTKPLFRATLTRAPAILSVLEEIRPYLTIKAEKADILMEWCRGQPERRHNHLVKILAARGRTLLTEVEEAWIVALWKDGFSIKAIVERVGRKRDTVSRALDRHGINWRINKTGLCRKGHARTSVKWGLDCKTCRHERYMAKRYA